MTRLAPPPAPLTDGVVTLRVPSREAGDADALTSYIGEGQLDGVWLPMVPRGSAAQSVGDWLEGWAGRPSHSGPVLVVTVADDARFVGVIGLGDRREGIVEMSYGIAPGWRGQGLASRAARLAAGWVLSLPGARAVELRIGQDAQASQHVAVNAGFVLAGRVRQFVPGTGKSFDDLRYVLDADSPQ